MHPVINRCPYTLREIQSVRVARTGVLDLHACTFTPVGENKVRVEARAYPYRGVLCETRGSATSGTPYYLARGARPGHDFTHRQDYKRSEETG